MSRDNYTRQEPVHPLLARKIANHVAEKVWDCTRLTQTAPGVFVHPETDWALVVMGAAHISKVGEAALRRSNLLVELVVLACASGQIVCHGPKVRYTKEEWAQVLEDCLAATQDVNVTMSVFEYAYANEPSRLSCLAEASSAVAKAIPFGVPATREERHEKIRSGGWKFLEHYEEGVTKILDMAQEEAA